jgi:hypothetical protein
MIFDGTSAEIVRKDFNAWLPDSRNMYLPR